MSALVKDNIKMAMENYLEASIAKHRVNVDILMSNGVGVAEHPDVMETIESELGKMAEYHDKLEMLKEYF